MSIGFATPSRISSGTADMKGFIQRLWKLLEVITEAVLKWVFHLLGRDMPQNAPAVFLQFIRFGLVGVSNTLVSYGVYVVTLLLLRRLDWLQGVDYYAAQIVAFILSVLWSFYWNNRFVFTVKSGETRTWWKALLKTYVSYSFTGLFLNSILLYLWVQLLNISEFLAPVINLLISVPLNFIINKFWAFRDERKEGDGENHDQLL